MKIRGLYFIIGLLVVTACQNNEKPRFVAVTPKVTLPVIHVKRYDKALFSLSPARFQEQLAAIAPEYPLFLNINLKDSSIVNDLKRFSQAPVNLKLSAEVNKQYGDLTFLEKGLSDAFSRCSSYFHGFQTPQVYTYISGMDYLFPVRYDQDNMAIGIDLFLGAGYRQYRQIQIPEYNIRRMNREEILPSAMKEVGRFLMSNQKPGNTLLDRMVYEGKLMLLLDAVLPDLADSTKIGYTGDQLAWCKENAANVWKFIIEGRLLYSNNPEENRRFIQDGPFTLSFGKESPSRIGVWMGWQIVRKYMNANPTATLEQLFRNNDSQSILEKSGYKPED